MDTKALRQKILDLAIRGKLVPQDQNDEPASVLLERIREQKKQMVKDGTIKPKYIKKYTVILKGDDNLHYDRFNDGTVKCIEDEIPFNLPEGWVWTKLGCITDVIQYGLSNSAESTGDYRLLRITDIQDGYVDWESVPFTNTDAAKKYLLHKNDIVFARTGATVCKSFLITDLQYNSVYASYLIRIRLIKGISANYIYQFFNSYCYWKQVTGKAIGVGQPNCNGTALKELFIPLPSQAEQNRIVSVANNLLKIADIISFEQEDLSELIQTAKSKILDLAIHGKLVPQDPNDEPATVLLERIRAEKEELIKQGKIKRDKKESVIFKGDDNSYYESIGDETTNIDDEIPFELPQNWEWSRLQTICYPITDGTHKTPTYSDTGYIFLSAKNITTGKINWNDVMYIPKSLHDELYSRISPQINDILLAKNGTTGVAAIVDRECEFDIYVTLALLRVISNNDILPQYLLKILASNTIQEYFNSSLKGICVPNLHLEHIRTTLIPIPPINEQKRISKKVDQLFFLLDSIAKNAN